MKYLITLIAIIFFGRNTYGQERLIKTTDVSSKNYYVDITYLNEGEPDINGRMFRVIITTSEIYDSLIIECLSQGEEGGNVKILNKRKVDLQSLWTAYNLKGEISGLEFVKWLTASSFLFKVENKIFIVKDISSPTLKISLK